MDKAPKPTLNEAIEDLKKAIFKEIVEPYFIPILDWLAKCINRRQQWITSMMRKD